MLTRAQIDQYDEHGYLVIEGLLDAVTIDGLKRVTDAFVENSRVVVGNDDIYDLAPSHAPGDPQVRRIKDPVDQHPAYDAVMRSTAVLDAIEGVIGPNIRFDHSKLNMKAPGRSGAAVEWHQDWAFYPHSNDDMLAVGVMLDDATDDNGPLMIVPGSHRGPVFDHHHDGRFCGAIDSVAAGLDTTRTVALTAPAGSISIHHVRAVHGSTANRSDCARRLLLLSYAAADAWPFLGARGHRGFDLDEFDSRIVRGRPTLEPRMTSVPIRMPLPDAEHDGSIFENQRPRQGASFDAAAAGT